MFFFGSFAVREDGGKKRIFSIPELCVQTPFASSKPRSCAARQLKLYVAPLNLNAPPFCKFSALKYSVFPLGSDSGFDKEDDVKTGVSCTNGLIASCAVWTEARLSSGVDIDDSKRVLKTLDDATVVDRLRVTKDKMTGGN